VGTHHRVAAPPLAVLAFAVTLSSVVSGCKKAESVAATSSAAPSASAPLDHLAPGELPPGTETVFGLALPEGLALRGVFPGVAHAFGPLSLQDVAAYVRTRVDSPRMEFAGNGAVFPAVHISGGDPTRLYRVEVNVLGQNTELVVRDVTPVPPPPGGLSDAERWRRAGYNPNGTPIDPLKLR
jgi:hypothetical protein